ncbi:DUF938 domain-containing protein [Sphingobium lactosutens]|uniref:SAM-dependent methyltransferase n=1 Tax=Sphingobium lactosutens DS20 TaxID=1331060 RepID=T0H9N9_9SPHN|nr:DUF938 domain-containing protein [Sphingobium lactosutens]EQB13061.1 hypothetical protein RLDS_17225 [Sphingobium lactosutens DS20]
MTIWVPGEAGAGGAEPCDPRRHAPATLRNRDDIVTKLRDMLPSSGLVLEVASGSGEHAVHFAAVFSELDWQPTDPDPTALASIAARRADAALPNLRLPLQLDASEASWPIDRADAVLCINMAHISPWDATVGLFTHAARLLPPGAPLILYGPWIRTDTPTAPSNLAFDADLRARDSRWGLRRAEDAGLLAERHGFGPCQLSAMPANNVMLLYRRTTASVSDLP